jgi:hypothetical protein
VKVNAVCLTDRAIQPSTKEHCIHSQPTKKLSNHKQVPVLSESIPAACKTYSWNVKLLFMRRDMRFHQQFFFYLGLLGHIVGFKHPDIVLEGVYWRRQVSVALSAFTALKLCY